jgi:hypothetical protein
MCRDTPRKPPQKSEKPHFEVILASCFDFLGDFGLSAGGFWGRMRDARLKKLRKAV